MPLSTSGTVLLLSRLSVHSLCSFDWSLWVWRLTHFAGGSPSRSRSRAVATWAWSFRMLSMAHQTVGSACPTSFATIWMLWGLNTTEGSGHYRWCQSSPGEVQVLLVCAPVDMSYPQEHHPLVKWRVHLNCLTGPAPAFQPVPVWTHICQNTAHSPTQAAPCARYFLNNTIQYHKTLLSQTGKLILQRSSS